MVSCQTIRKLLCKMVKLNFKCSSSSLINLSSSAILFGQWPGTDLASTLFTQMLKMYIRSRFIEDSKNCSIYFT